MRRDEQDETRASIRVRREAAHTATDALRVRPRAGPLQPFSTEPSAARDSFILLRLPPPAVCPVARRFGIELETRRNTDPFRATRSRIVACGSCPVSLLLL